MTTAKTASTPAPAWPVTIGLLVLTAVPSLAGIARLVSLASGGPVSAENARFFAAPLPAIIHIISVLLYCIVGAFQFAPVRRYNITWHRLTGRVLVVAGIISALSGLWMNQFYAIPAELQGPLLYTVRILVGLGMLASIILAWLRILKKDVASHRAWMIRAYALGQGAGTQVLTMLPPAILLGGDITGFPRDVLMSLAWVINLLVAEWIIRRPQFRQNKKPQQVTAS